MIEIGKKINYDFEHQHWDMVLVITLTIPAYLKNNIENLILFLFRL